MTCPRCAGAHLAADPECPRCGLPFPVAAVPTPVTAVTPVAGAPRTTWESERPWIVRGAAVVGVLVCAFAALTYLGLGDDEDSPGSVSAGRPGEIPAGEVTQGAPTGPNLAATATVRADRTADPAEDSAGNPVTYDAAHLIDGDLATAWRATGYYSGEGLTITLPARSEIQVVGLTNGYTKVDASSGDDRYARGRRIQSVTWSFDQGHSVTQKLKDGDREIQYLRIDPVQATTIRLRVNATTTPGKFTDDYTAISELFVSAR